MGLKFVGIAVLCLLICALIVYMNIFSFSNGLFENNYKGNVPYLWYKFVKGVTIVIDFILIVILAVLGVILWGKLMRLL